MAVTLSKKINTFLRLLVKPKMINVLVSFYHSGYLLETGWIRSYLNGFPVDKAGNSLPWFTLSFISFLETRLDKSIKIFEYGAGNSTIYFSSRVNNLTSIESDSAWLKQLKTKLSQNCIIESVSSTDPDAYSKRIFDFDQKFDVVIVDAIFRNESMINCIPALSERGVVILDDSEREEYQSTINEMLKLGFKKIDFWGMAPGVTFNKCTSIFYKSNNCMGI
ncbi:MAG: FkbM family methyltransferase [Ignavibacteriales bacterium]|nr:FkbM family methyltransferase [Ignavibacteriales bacterium]